MPCKVKGCARHAVAGGMCAMHYMRVKRTGDPNVRLKPGPKTGPAPKTADALGDFLIKKQRQEIDALCQEVATLRAENAALASDRRAAFAAALADALAAEREKNATLQRELAKAPAAAKPKQQAKPDETEAKLRKEIRQLRQRLRNVAESGKGTLFISAADRRKIRAALHPNGATDPVRRKRLTEASQIFNNLPMSEIELD